MSMTEKIQGSLGRSRKVKHKKRSCDPTVKIDRSNKTIQVVYKSTGDIRQMFEQNSAVRSWLSGLVSGHHGEDWMPRDFTPERAIQCATAGLPDHVDTIKGEIRRVEKLDVQIVFPNWENDYVGAVPDVPAFCAGDMQCMKNLRNSVNDTRPIKIFVGMASSSCFTEKQLASRGAIVSALALQLSKTRVVEVYSVNSGEMKGYAWSVMVKMPRALALSDLSYWLCCQASTRGLLYSIERAMTGDLSWPGQLFGLNYNSPKGIEAHARIWGAADTDIVVPFPYGSDNAMLNDPENWMRNTLARVNAI